MPITFTPLGADLDITIIDGNMQEVETFFKGMMRDVDFIGRFSRFRIRRFTSGRVVAAHTFANPYRGQSSGQTGQSIDRFDITYRAGTEQAGLHTESAQREDSTHAYSMELLGKPGPSFYYKWQEDGMPAPNVQSPGVANWPPTEWPKSRYPGNLCFSNWLTVPGACIKVWVPQRCNAVVSGHGKGSMTIYDWVGSGSTPPSWLWPPWVPPPNPAPVVYPDRSHRWYRFGLIVDTNPILYTDEFVNDNPNIQGDYRSWQVFEDIDLRVAQREKVDLWGEINLRGGRWYNFRLAFRRSGTFGFIEYLANAFHERCWEDTIEPLTGWGMSQATSTTAMYDMLVETRGNYFNANSPPWINLWESAGLSIQFDYGRSQAEVDSTVDADFYQFLR